MRKSTGDFIFNTLRKDGRIPLVLPLWGRLQRGKRAVKSLFNSLLVRCGLDAPHGHVVGDIFPDERADVTPALGNLDQAMQLLIIERSFNLKFYLNFLYVALFVGTRTDRGAAERRFAHPRRHPQRHQQTSAEGAEEGANRIDAAIVSVKNPSMRAVRRIDAKGIARG